MSFRLAASVKYHALVYDNDALLDYLPYPFLLCQVPCLPNLKVNKFDLPKESKQIIRGRMHKNYKNFLKFMLNFLKINHN